MLANADEVDEHRRIAARVETVGQAAAREVLFAEPVTGQRVPGGGVVVPGRREGDDLWSGSRTIRCRPGSPAAGGKVALGTELDRRPA